MQAVVMAVVTSLAAVVRSRMALQIEILALRHQLAVYQRAGRRPHRRPADRILWAWLSRAWSGWREALDRRRGHFLDTLRWVDLTAGTKYLILLMRKWRNWQTRRIQDPVG